MNTFCTFFTLWFHPCLFIPTSLDAARADSEACNCWITTRTTSQTTFVTALYASTEDVRLQWHQRLLPARFPDGINRVHPSAGGKYPTPECSGRRADGPGGTVAGHLSVLGSAHKDAHSSAHRRNICECVRVHGFSLRYLTWVLAE